MDNIQKQQRQQRMHQLAQELHTLRDALTQMSLLLHDLHFEVDALLRRNATELAAAHIAPSQNGQA